MILVLVTYHCRPGMREAFLHAIQTEKIDEACRKEAGNLQYDYYLPIDQDDDLFLLEKWRDAEAVSVHNSLPHYARLQDLKGQYVEHTVLEKHELS